jgi:hypothetical protein
MPKENLSGAVTLSELSHPSLTLFGSGSGAGPVTDIPDTTHQFASLLGNTTRHARVVFANTAGVNPPCRLHLL